MRRIDSQYPNLRQTFVWRQRMGGADLLHQPTAAVRGKMDDAPGGKKIRDFPLLQQAPGHAAVAAAMGKKHELRADRLQKPRLQPLNAVMGRLHDIRRQARLLSPFGEEGLAALADIGSQQHRGLLIAQMNHGGAIVQHRPLHLLVHPQFRPLKGQQIPVIQGADRNTRLLQALNGGLLARMLPALILRKTSIEHGDADVLYQSGQTAQVVRVGMAVEHRRFLHPKPVQERLQLRPLNIPAHIDQQVLPPVLEQHAVRP